MTVMLITGGFGGLGTAISRRAEREGATVVRTSRQPADGGLAHDVADAASWQRVLDTVIQQHGRLDVLVNAAGGVGPTPQDVLSTTPQTWHEALDAHVVGTWLGCREIIRRAPEYPVSIVNLSSTAGQLATPGMLAYGAVKAAVEHLTASIALHCARAGLPIRCNAIAPALVDGGLRDDVLGTVAPDPDEALSRYLSRVPIGRLVSPEEVADTVWYLATGGGMSLTGQVVTVAGGLGLS